MSCLACTCNHPPYYWALLSCLNFTCALLSCRAVTCVQGVMLDIVAMILIVVEENLPFGVLWTPWSDLFYACMFWFVFLLVIYCLFFCFL
jgi:hypothetical protein